MGCLKHLDSVNYSHTTTSQIAEGLEYEKHRIELALILETITREGGKYSVLRKFPLHASSSLSTVQFSANGA